jgi:deoxyribonuclease-4
MRPTGYHITGGQRLGSSLLATVDAGFSAAQIFLGPPQKFRQDPIPQDEANLFRRIKRNSGIKVFVHAPYVLHAFAKPENTSKNNTFLKKLVQMASELECDGFVLHMGGTKWYETAEYHHVATKLFEDIFGREEGQPVPILFENCANGNDMSGDILAINNLISVLKTQGHNVGLCLDTLHAWAFGYNYQDDSHLRMVLEPRMLSHLKLIHLNSGPDKVTCGSKYDRHEAIHKGCIPRECFSTLLKALPNIPVIIEGHEFSDILSDIAFVKHVESESDEISRTPNANSDITGSSPAVTSES